MIEAERLLQAAIDLTPGILEVRDAFDRDRALPPPLVERLRTAGMFHLWLPRALGGPELHPADFLPVIEALARADGSVGWCTSNASVLSLLAGSLDEAGARDIFGRHAIVAGGANPMGTAVAVPGGYRVTGRWPYGTGILHSTWLAANSVVQDGDTPRRAASGAPEMRFMFFPRSAAEIIDNWDVSGLRGTGSHDYRISDLFVPETHTTIALAVDPRQPGTLYRVPPLSLFALALASVTLGIARAAIDALIELSATTAPLRARTVLMRDSSFVQVTVARAEAMLRSARAGVLDAVCAQWEATEAGTADPMAARLATRLATTWCAEVCASAVNLVHVAAGGIAIQESGRIARCLRDVNAATQHISLGQTNYEPCGRVLLGLDPGTPRF